MRFQHYLRQIATLPPRLVIDKATGKVRHDLATLYRRLYSSLRPSRSTWSEVPTGDLYGYVRPFTADVSRAFAGEITALAELHCAHRFDLLGSGWVKLEYGMRCRGLEGHRYDMGAPVEADGDGRWLRRRINTANLRDSRHIWRLVSGRYTPIDWQLDFKSGYRWSENSLSLDIGLKTPLGSDILVPWSLAQMHHLVQLALAYALAVLGHEGDQLQREYTREFRDQVLDFIATNPPDFGVIWCSPMATAVRVANWLVAFDVFRGHGAEFDEAFRREFMRGVYDHGRHIIGNLEWRPQFRHNHYLANVVGLLFAAAYLPRTPETDVWLAFSVQELVKEVGRQFSPDGVNFEASTAYHFFCAEMVVYATALVLGLPGDKRAALETYDHRLHRSPPPLDPAPLAMHRLPGSERVSPFPGWYLERLERMAEFVLHATKPNGNVPQIGDGSDSRFLKFLPACAKRAVAEAKARYANLDGYDELAETATYWDENPLDHRSLAAAACGLFDRDDLAAFAGGERPEASIVEGLARNVRLASYRGPDAPTAAERVSVGNDDDWESALAEVERLPEKRCETLEIPTQGASLHDGLARYAYPDFGLYIFRSRRLYLAVRCGPVGQNGRGGHAHNDQLSIELNVDGEDWIADPGTYLYSTLLERRNAYRSAEAHAAPHFEGHEPSPLDLGVFRLDDRTQARCLYFGPRGFVGSPTCNGARVYRLVELTEQRIIIRDASAGVAGSTLVSGLERRERVAFSPGYGRLRRS